MSKKASETKKTLSSKQLRQVWSEIKPVELVERLRALSPDGRWSSSGYRVSGRCPYHDDRTPSFHIYLDRGYAKCFGCDHFNSNPVDFWRSIRGISRADATTELRQQFGVKGLNASAASKVQEWERHQELKQKVATFCHNELISAITHPDDPRYAAAQPAVKYLLEARKIPRDVIPSLPMLGVMPAVGHIVDHLNKESERETARRKAQSKLDGTRLESHRSLGPDAQEYLKPAADWLGAITFRLDTTPDNIGRIKLRRPGLSEFRYLDEAFEEELGFLGLGWNLYAGLIGASDSGVPGAYLVEGEFDALSVMAQQVLAGGPGFVTVSSSGSAGGPQIDSLHGLGFEEVYLVSDSPLHNGDSLVKTWLSHIRKLRARIFIDYDKFPGAGDPDEIVAIHGLPAFQKSMLGINDPAVFQHPQDWIFDRASVKLQNIPENDTRYRTEIAAEWGRYLKNGIECDAYIGYCGKYYQVPEANLKREIIAKEEDEPAFIHRLANKLQEIYYVIGQQSFESTRKLQLWHRRLKKIVHISLADDNGIEREFTSTEGAYFDFFEHRVGLPEFLQPTDMQASGKYLLKQESFFKYYIRQAFTILAQGSPDFDTARRLGQGIHVLRDTIGEGAPKLYVVNGRDVFHGVFDALGALKWNKLEGPSHDGFLFDVGDRVAEASWLKGVQDVKSLERATELDLRKVWERLHAVVDLGWSYKNHAISSKFLASHLLAATLCNAFRRQVMVAFHADTRAGKSKMLMGLISGTSYPRIQLISSAFGMPDYTAAGIRQEMNNKVRPLCLDEFEDEGGGDRKGRTVTESLEMFRNLTGEDNVITKGSRHGQPQVFRLNFFVFIAAISKARRVQDANRMVTVFMERQNNRPDPVQVLMREFGLSYLDDLRKDLEVALLPYAAKIQETYDAIEKEYGHAGAAPSNIDSRVFEALYPALTVMKLVGEDYKKFALDFCEANQEDLSVTAGHTDSAALFDWICNSPKLKARTGENRERNDATLLLMLMNPDTRREINSTGAGIFFDEVSEQVFVQWTTAIQTVLSSHPRYSKETNVYNLRDLANRAPLAIPPSELATSSALRRLRSQGLAGVPLSHLSAFDVSSIIASINQGSSPLNENSEKEGDHSLVEEEEVIDDGNFS